MRMHLHLCECCTLQVCSLHMAYVSGMLDSELPVSACASCSQCVWPASSITPVVCWAVGTVIICNYPCILSRLAGSLSLPNVMFNNEEQHPFTYVKFTNVQYQTSSCHAVPGCVHIWGRDMPFEDVRKASGREDGVQNYLYTPHASTLKKDHPNFSVAVKLFQERWAAREPVLVRDVRGLMSWKPDVSERAGLQCV